LACHLDIVELLLSLTGDRYINVHAADEFAFCFACSDGRHEIVELLLSLTGDRRIDVHVEDECAFRYACYNGHLTTVELLLSLTGDRHIDVNALDDYAFRYASKYNHLGIVERLVCLGGDRAIPGRLLAELGANDLCKRTLIAEWATGAARERKSDKHKLWGGMERVALAEVLRLLARPW
jgi:ankyrin repeat protein